MEEEKTIKHSFEDDDEHRAGSKSVQKSQCD